MLEGASLVLGVARIVEDDAISVVLVQREGAAAVHTLPDHELLVLLNIVYDMAVLLGLGEGLMKKQGPHAGCEVGGRRAVRMTVDAVRMTVDAVRMTILGICHEYLKRYCREV